jgi:WD40 repeat protein
VTRWLRAAVAVVALVVGASCSAAPGQHAIPRETVSAGDAGTRDTTDVDAAATDPSGVVLGGGSARAQAPTARLGASTTSTITTRGTTGPRAPARSAALPIVPTTLLPATHGPSRILPDGCEIVQPATANPDPVAINAVGIWVVLDEGARNLVPRYGVGPATFAPDGHTLATLFQPSIDASGDELFTIDIDTLAHTVLPDAGADLAWPAWSPDGHTIAYYAGHTPDPDYGRRLFLYDVASGTRRHLVDVEQAPTPPIWSADSLHVALTQPNRNEVVIVDVLTGLIHRVSFPLPFTISFAPDGLRVVVSGVDGDTEIIDTITGLRTPIDPGGEHAMWSPDGLFIAAVHHNGSVTLIDPLTHLSRQVLEVGDPLRWMLDGLHLLAYRGCGEVDSVNVVTNEIRGITRGDGVVPLPFGVTRNGQVLGFQAS